MGLILGGNMISAAGTKNHEMPESSTAYTTLLFKIDLRLAQTKFHTNTRTECDE